MNCRLTAALRGPWLLPSGPRMPIADWLAIEPVGRGLGRANLYGARALGTGLDFERDTLAAD